MAKYDAALVYSRQELADSYDQDRFTSASGKMVDVIEKSIVLRQIKSGKKGDSILEVGSGTGRFSLEFAGYGLNVTACDISLPLLKVIEKKMNKLNKMINLVNGDIYNLPFKDNNFDFVASIRVLNQLREKDEKRDSIKELCRICRPNGIIILEFINSNSLSRFGKNGTLGLISIKEMKNIIKEIPNVELNNIEGSLFSSATIFEKIPVIFLNIHKEFDCLLCKLLPFYATRIYFIIQKTDL